MLRVISGVADVPWVRPIFGDVRSLHWWEGFLHCREFLCIRFAWSFSVDRLVTGLGFLRYWSLVLSYGSSALSVNLCNDYEAMSRSDYSDENGVPYIYELVTSLKTSQCDVEVKKNSRVGQRYKPRLIRKPRISRCPREISALSLYNHFYTWFTICKYPKFCRRSRDPLWK